MRVLGQRGLRRILVVGVACLLTVAAEGEMHRPLRIIAPGTTPMHSLEAWIGFGFNQNEYLLFQNLDTDRRLYSFPEIDLAVGMAENVELRISYPLLFLKKNSESLQSGSGDLRVTSVFNIIKEAEYWPACALLLGVKAPNASDDRGFGTDQTDLFAAGAFSKKFGSVTVLANVGIGILDNPNILNSPLCDPNNSDADATSQDDVLMYGLGVLYRYNEKLTFACELEGLFNSRFGNDRSYARCGMAYNFGPVVVDASVGTGLDDRSGELLLAAGATFRFGFRER